MERVKQEVITAFSEVFDFEVTEYLRNNLNLEL